MDDRLITSTFFKATGRNSYIPTESCHHKTWLKSVPRSQFDRLKRNCTLTSHFEKQVPLLKNRFIEKGFNVDVLGEEINHVRGLDRNSRLTNKILSNVSQKF